MAEGKILATALDEAAQVAEALADMAEAVTDARPMGTAAEAERKAVVDAVVSEAV